MPTHPCPQAPPTRRLARFLPLALLAVVGLAAWWTGVLHMLAPSELARHTAQLRAHVAAAPWLSAAVFILAYAGLTGACLPVALGLSLAGGLLFGRWAGWGVVLLGSTGAALITYGAVRSAFAPSLVAWAERDARLQRIVAGFGANAFSYVLTLRLMPFFPFALVNIGSGLAGAPWRAFGIATLLGGVPTSFIYASLGASLQEQLASKGSLSAALRSPTLIAALAALAALSLLPVLFRRFRRPLAP